MDYRTPNHDDEFSSAIEKAHRCRTIESGLRHGIDTLYNFRKGKEVTDTKLRFFNDTRAAVNSRIYSSFHDGYDCFTEFLRDNTDLKHDKSEVDEILKNLSGLERSIAADKLPDSYNIESDINEAERLYEDITDSIEETGLLTGDSFYLDG